MVLPSAEGTEWISTVIHFNRAYANGYTGFIYVRHSAIPAPVPLGRPPLIPPLTYLVSPTTTCSILRSRHQIPQLRLLLAMVCRPVYNGGIESPHLAIMVYG